MKKRIPGITMLARFSGKDVKRVTDPVDYARRQVEDHLVWFCDKRMIRLATASERKRWDSMQDFSAENCELMDNYVLTWRGHAYFRDRSDPRPKHKEWEDWMAERLGNLADLVESFADAYSRRNLKDAIGYAFEIGKLAERLRAMRNDPAVGKGRKRIEIESAMQQAAAEAKRIRPEKRRAIIAARLSRNDSVGRAF
jgi:hypothetical protein